MPRRLPQRSKVRSGIASRLPAPACPQKCSQVDRPHRMNPIVRDVTTYYVLIRDDAWAAVVGVVCITSWFWAIGDFFGISLW